MFSLGMKKKEQAIERILTQNYNSYYRLAYSYVHNEMDAGDIVQNGAYKAILNSHTLKQEGYASTWVYRIMMNEIFQFLRTRQAAGREVLAFSDENQPEPGTEDRYEDIDLRRALDSMPDKDKAVIELRYFEELKLEEIAEILNENVNTIKSRLYRGLKKLRMELEDAPSSGCSVTHASSKRMLRDHVL